MTGKRHEFAARFDVGFDDQGRIEGIRIELASRCGATVDLSPAINDRAMFHADNCYFLPAVEIVSHRLRTHTVSNTAFRGFGGPQGMMAIERAMDAIAAHLDIDSLAVRVANLYGPGRDLTPYHMAVTDNVAPEIIAELAERTDYPRAAPRSSVQCRASLSQARHRADPGQVRHQLHHQPTSTRRARWCWSMPYGSIHLNHAAPRWGRGCTSSSPRSSPTCSRCRSRG